MQYKIDELIEFNPALVYGFEPEASPQRMEGSETLLDTLVPEASQHQDMLKAYLYAQNTILPIIRMQGFSSVNEARFLEWISTLHGFIGKTLLAMYGEQAGTYTKQIVTRWHNGCDLFNEFVSYFSNEHICKKITILHRI